MIPYLDRLSSSFYQGLTANVKIACFYEA